MTTLSIALAVMLAFAIAGWVWAEFDCLRHKRKANRIEQYNNWLETRHSLVSNQLAHLRALQKEVQ
jgi:hypothetical protein